MQVWEKSGYNTVEWVRYITKAGSYEVRCWRNVDWWFNTKFGVQISVLLLTRGWGFTHHSLLLWMLVWNFSFDISEASLLLEYHIYSFFSSSLLFSPLYVQYFVVVYLFSCNENVLCMIYVKIIEISHYRPLHEVSTRNALPSHFKMRHVQHTKLVN